jgi:hypothetical protein
MCCNDFCTILSYEVQVHVERRSHELRARAVQWVFLRRYQSLEHREVKVRVQVVVERVVLVQVVVVLVQVVVVLVVLVQIVQVVCKVLGRVA